MIKVKISKQMHLNKKLINKQFVNLIKTIKYKKYLRMCKFYEYLEFFHLKLN